MHATHNDLSLEVRSQSVAILNAMLADTSAAGSNGTNAEAAAQASA
jgi:hypothetical protein